MKKKILAGGLLAAQSLISFAGHNFISTGDGYNRVSVFAEDGSCVWEYKTEKPYSAKVLNNGNILLTSHYSVKCIDKDKKLVWEYKPQGKIEVFGADTLSDGRVVIAESTNLRITILEASGKKISAFDLPASPPKAKKLNNAVVTAKPRGNHGSTRALTVSPQDTILVGHLVENTVREYSLDGRVINEFMLPGKAYMGARLANGNTLIGHENGVTELAPDKSVVWQVMDKDVPSQPFNFITAVKRLENGNTVICNWLGHGFKGVASPIFEVNPDKQVVWKYDRTDEVKLPTSFNVLTESQFESFTNR